MKTFKVAVEKESFKGHCEVEIPGFLERAAYIKQIADMKNGDEVDGSRLLVFLYDVFKRHVKAMHFETHDGERFDSIEEFEYFVESSEVIQEVAMYVCQGIRLGKK